MSTNWKADLEARAEAVYDDKAVRDAVVERMIERMTTSGIQHIKSFAEQMENAIDNLPTDTAIEFLTLVRDEFLEEQQKMMRGGYAPNKTDGDRYVADNVIEFVGLHIQLLDDFIAILKEEEQ